MSSINEKLTRIDNSISSLKTKLKLDESAEIEEIEEALTPKVGFTVDEWTENGYMKKITIYGFTTIPAYYMGVGSYSGLTEEKLGSRQYIEEIIITEGTTKIETLAFGWLVNLKKVVLPETFTSCGTSPFGSCKLLTDINIPNTMTELPAYLFRSTGIKKFEIPDYVIKIGANVFQDCKSLIQISMNNVQTIGYSSYPAFYNSSLKAIWIGSAIENMYTSFTSCPNIKKMFIDLPRILVEALPNYSKAFGNNVFNINNIICNDDEGFISKEEFDAIDWSSVE